MGHCDMTTVLAGVGIGGIAIALAAQKTVKNLFGDRDDHRRACVRRRLL
jgi:hypothetical protein